MKLGKDKAQKQWSFYMAYLRIKIYKCDVEEQLNSIRVTCKNKRSIVAILKIYKKEHKKSYYFRSEI